MTIGISGLDAADETEYERAVREAGGTPLRLENDVTKIDEYLASCDGVILSGGWDVSAAFGGAAWPNETHEPLRDGFELELARRLRDRTIPTLGICRGLQLLNVAFGGTLTADIHDATGLPAGAHQPRLSSGEKNRDVIAEHVVTLRDGLLARTFGALEFPTTSRHHQAIATVADSLRVVGTTPDGIVEAVEATFAHPWFAAVQWHPETSAVTQDDAPSRALFRAFVAASRGAAAPR